MRVALAWRNEFHETRGSFSSSQVGARARLYRFLGQRGFPGLYRIRGSLAQCEGIELGVTLAPEIVPRSLESLAGCCEFGLPNRPSE